MLLLPGEPRLDELRRVLAALHRDLRHARQVHRHHVADDEDLGVTGQRAVGQDLHPAGAVDLGARLLGELLAQRAGSTPAAQILVTASIRRWLPSGSLTSSPFWSMSTTIAPSWISTPSRWSLFVV